MAEIAQFSHIERSEYEESLKVLRDLTNVIDTAALKSLSFPIETIMQVTGLSVDEIESIK